MAELSELPRDGQSAPCPNCLNKFIFLEKQLDDANKAVEKLEGQQELSKAEITRLKTELNYANKVVEEEQRSLEECHDQLKLKSQEHEALQRLRIANETHDRDSIEHLQGELKDILNTNEKLRDQLNKKPMTVRKVQYTQEIGSLPSEMDASSGHTDDSHCTPEFTDIVAESPSEDDVDRRVPTLADELARCLSDDDMDADDLGDESTGDDSITNDNNDPLGYERTYCGKLKQEQTMDPQPAPDADSRKRKENGQILGPMKRQRAEPSSSEDFNNLNLAKDLAKGTQLRRGEIAVSNGRRKSARTRPARAMKKPSGNSLPQATVSGLEGAAFTFEVGREADKQSEKCVDLKNTSGCGVKSTKTPLEIAEATAGPHHAQSEDLSDPNLTEKLGNEISRDCKNDAYDDDLDQKKPPPSTKSTVMQGQTTSISCDIEMKEGDFGSYECDSPQVMSHGTTADANSSDQNRNEQKLRSFARKRQLSPTAADNGSLKMQKTYSKAMDHFIPTTRPKRRPNGLNRRHASAAKTLVPCTKDNPPITAAPVFPFTFTMKIPSEGPRDDGTDATNAGRLSAHVKSGPTKSSREGTTYTRLSHLFKHQRGLHEQVNVLGIVVSAAEGSPDCFSISDFSRSPIVVEGKFPKVNIGDCVLLWGFTVCSHTKTILPFLRQSKDLGDMEKSLGTFCIWNGIESSCTHCLQSIGDREVREMKRLRDSWSEEPKARIHT